MFRTWLVVAKVETYTKTEERTIPAHTYEPPANSYHNIETWLLTLQWLVMPTYPLMANHQVPLTRYPLMANHQVPLPRYPLMANHQVPLTRYPLMANHQVPLTRYPLMANHQVPLPRFPLMAILDYSRLQPYTLTADEAPLAPATCAAETSNPTAPWSMTTSS